ncbi:Ig-like domain-containing protein [Gemmatimonas sp.]
MNPPSLIRIVSLSIAPLRRLSLLSILALGVACGGDPAAPDVPASVTVAANGSTTIASGSAVQFTVTYRDTKGRAVNNPSVSWSSSDVAVATVAPTGLVIGARAGTATISAVVNGTTGSSAVTVTAGAAAKLAVVTQPAGAAQRVPLTTQPVVEIRDAADNVVTSSSASVLVTATVGGVTGSTTATAQNGVVRFTDLALQGTAGTRQLQFSSGSLTPANSAAIDLAAGPAATVAFVGTAPRLRSGLAAGNAVAVQLLDQDGNEVALAGRRVVAAVSGGFGTIAATGTTATTNSLGRALFSDFTLSGTAGVRTLTFTADSMPAPAAALVTVTGGTPTRLVFDRDVPATIEVGNVMSPPPVLRLVDAFSNLVEQAGVTVSASSSGATLTGAQAVTDALGRATFSVLRFASGLGARTVAFNADAMAAAASRVVTVAPADESVQPASILTARAESDTGARNIELATTTSNLLPYLLARDAQGQAMSTAGVRWFSRDPSQVTVAADGRITGVSAGRTFVVAQASRTLGVADSVLVYVPKSGTGPIVRATLPSYRVRTDTFSITIEIVPRDGRTVSAADMEIAWPGNRAGVFSPFNVTAYNVPRNDVVTQQVDGAQSLRLTWASATPVAGPVTLIRLRCQVNQRGQWNQVLITLNQLLQGDLTDLTSSTSVFNPLVVIP